MDTTVSIEARAVQHGPDGIPYLLTRESPLCVDLQLQATGPLPGNADLILTAHELFSGHTMVLPDAVPELPEALGGQTRLRIPSERFELRPGCWHILVDIMRGERSLAGTHAGSTEVYVRDEGESPLYARACHNLGRAEYAFDRRQGLFLPRYRSLLPPTVDPFSDEDAPVFCRSFATAELLSPEMIHDGGLGFLLAAHAFRAMGREQRARYCEEGISRAVHVICDPMKGEDGHLHAVTADGKQQHQQERHFRHAEALALKFLCQTYFYFRRGQREEKDYARYVLNEAADLFRLQLGPPLGPGRTGECRAADGRVMAGLAWYCLAHKSEHGQFFSPDARNALIEFATAAARELLANDGWYDLDCRLEDGNHLWRANIDLVGGLLPVLRMLQVLGERGDDQAAAAAEPVRRAIERGLLFVTRLGAPLSDAPPAIPSALPDQVRGTAYEACEHYLANLGTDPSVQQFLRHLGTHRDGAVTGSFAGLSASGAALLLSPEFGNLQQKPPLPWWD